MSNTNTPVHTKKPHTTKLRPSERVFEIALAMIEKKGREIAELRDRIKQWERYSDYRKSEALGNVKEIEKQVADNLGMMNAREEWEARYYKERAAALITERAIKSCENANRMLQRTVGRYEAATAEDFCRKMEEK
jgi:hypothetical protein